MSEQQAMLPGQLIHGRYRIDIALASGGQADVYRAHHVELDREVAIKVLKTHGSAEVRERTATRFEQEARLISKLRDPHTITLYDFGRLEDGALFMVFEYIDGISLKELVARQGPVEPYRVAKILKQTLSSLHEAHSMGVLHRDLKPANIMVFEHAGRTDQVKLLDFGIAKILREDDAAISNPNLTGDRIIGTPRYIAPELLLRETPTPASDLYSLGLVAYELIVGRPAIKERAALQIIAKQIDPRDFTLPRDVEIHRELRRIINKLMLKQPAGRYQDVTEVSLELKRWMRRSVPPTLDDQMFDDVTPADDIEAMKEYSKRSKGKSGLHVLMPDSSVGTAPDLTPRTAFSQSIVFQGKPSAREVNTLIKASMNHEHRAVNPSQIAGYSATQTASSPEFKDHTQQIYVNAALLEQTHAAALSPALSSPLHSRGGDTMAIDEPIRAHHRPARARVDHQKVAMLIIVILMIVILAIAVVFALLVMGQDVL